MKNMFDCNNYKDLLNNYVKSSAATRGLRTELAKAMGCQAAYLTQVLNGKAELTEDHAYRLARHLELPKLEFEYLILLVRLARARTNDLRVFLENERLALVAQQKEVRSRLENDEVTNDVFIKKYFSQWFTSAIHVATSSENYQTVEALSQRLALPQKTVIENLKFLEEFGLVKREGKRWFFAGGPLHLDRKNEISRSFQVHRRLQVVRAIQQNDGAENLHFSSVFTLDKKTFEDLKKDFLDGIQAAHKKIHAGGTEELYALTLDLFEMV